MTASIRKIAALAAATALLLAGCASGEEASAPAPEPTATTEAPSPSEATSPAVDDDVDALATVDPDDIAALEDAQEILGDIGYVPGADQATCDAVFGPGEDAVLAMFTESQDLTDADAAIDHVQRTVGRIEEVAAAAPAEVAGHLEMLAGALALTTTFEGRSQLDQVVADTETSMTGIGEYCFGA